MIEVKNSDAAINTSLLFFQEKYHLPANPVVKELKLEKVEKGVEIVKGDPFLKSLFFMKLNCRENRQDAFLDLLRKKS